MVSHTARCFFCRLDRIQERQQLDQVHFTRVIQAFAGDGNQAPYFFQPRPAAFRAVVFDHDLFEVFVHARIRRSLLPVPAIVMFQLVDDTREFDLLARVLLPLLRSGRQ
jgi:hypothetical protein